MKQRHLFTRARIMLFYLCLLGMLLLLAACSGMSNPGSQPNNQPSNVGGYNLLHLVDQQIQNFVPFPGR